MHGSELYSSNYLASRLTTDDMNASGARGTDPRGRFIFLGKNPRRIGIVEQNKRKFLVKKAASILVNTGSYENLTFSESIEGEIEFSSLDEFKTKNHNLTLVLNALLKRSTEETLAQTCRQRIVNGKPAELWAHGA